MQYKEFKGSIRISRLGMGNMRLPVLEDQPGRPIDYEKASGIIDGAIRMGVNYFDTAYIYHGGDSERFTGKALAAYPRDSYYVADKFNLEANPDYRAQFEEQFERLGMEYIDFYMLHGVMDHSVDRFLTNGCIEYFDGLKKQGRIRNLGFSFHGSTETMRSMLRAYRWDFAQIQLNYYDWFYGDAKDLYEQLSEAHVPAMVMEPVHGGMLATLNDESCAILKAAAPERSIASWAMRWVMSLENVQVILSGMSDPAQLADNAASLSENKPLPQEELSVVEKAAALFRSSVSVPCTACRYCTDDCPVGLDIPLLLAAYNTAKVGGAWRLTTLRGLPEDKLPAACIGCGACAGHCPQSIAIPEMMRELAQMMG